MKTIMLIIVIIVAGAPVLFWVGSLIYGFVIGPIIDAIKNKNDRSDNITSAIVGGAILIIITFCIAWYPWFVTTNYYGETVCKNIFGYTMNCR